MGPLDTTTEIETPEHLRFRHRLAGPARRALAYLIDTMVRGVIATVVVLLASVGGLFAGDLGAASQGLILLALFVLEWGYYVLCETVLNGRSPGKMALKLRVVTTSGHPLTVVDSMLRNLLRAADFLPAAYAIGVLVMGRDDKFRRLGDMVAGTMVVVEDRHIVDSALIIHPPPAPEELRFFPERIPLTAEELDAVELLLRRRGRLAPMREFELAEIVAPVFAKRMGIRVQPGVPFDPYRFLQLIYHRARGMMLAQTQPQRGYRPQFPPQRPQAPPQPQAPIGYPQVGPHAGPPPGMAP